MGKRGKASEFLKCRRSLHVFTGFSFLDPTDHSQKDEF